MKTARLMNRAQADRLGSLKRKRERAWRLGMLRDYLACLRAEARLGSGDAIYTLAVHYRDGLRDRRGRVLLGRHRTRYLESLRRAVALRDRDAMTSLADELTDPRRLVSLPPSSRRRSFAEGLRGYRAAVARGSSVAAFNLAMTYLNAGRHHLAVKWLRRAAAAGDQPEASLELARAELLGLGTRRDVPAALSTLRRAAHEWRGRLSPLDVESSMVLLATLCREGWLVRRDYGAACRWLRRAARLGSWTAKGLLRDLGEPER